MFWEQPWAVEESQVATVAGRSRMLKAAETSFPSDAFAHLS